MRAEQKKHKKIIGSYTTYLGNEIRGLNGHRVQILAVLRGALSPGYNPDADDSFVNDDAELERLGGITAADRLDVQPLHFDGHQSFVHVAPRAIDLAAFKHLRQDQ